jgi:hypothetical protein
MPHNRAEPRERERERDRHFKISRDPGAPQGGNPGAGGQGSKSDHVPCIMYHVSCIMYHVSCIILSYNVLLASAGERTRRNRTEHTSPSSVFLDFGPKRNDLFIRNMSCFQKIRFVFNKYSLFFKKHDLFSKNTICFQKIRLVSKKNPQRFPNQPL